MLKTTAKGVIVEIVEDDQMPIDPVTGARADIIMDPTSIPSRMNVSRLYEQYFNAMSRHTQKLVINMIDQLTDVNLSTNEKVDILTPEETGKVFDIVLGLLSILETEQYSGYLNLRETNNVYNMNIILKEILDKELFLYYKSSSDKNAYQIVLDAQGTMYEPHIGHIHVSKQGELTLTKDKMMVAPLYVILLFKTGDEYLSTASSRTNHYNFPISAGKNLKNALPFRNSPVKISGETESRIFSVYADQKVIAELKDRANSLNTHRHLYDNILKAENPTDIEHVVNREEMPYGEDSAIQLVDSVFNCAGIELVYIDED